jgi:hypothetical protein
MKNRRGGEVKLQVEAADPAADQAVELVASSCKEAVV